MISKTNADQARERRQPGPNRSEIIFFFLNTSKGDFIPSEVSGKYLNSDLSVKQTRSRYPLPSIPTRLVSFVYSAESTQDLQREFPIIRSVGKTPDGLRFFPAFVLQDSGFTFSDSRRNRGEIGGKENGRSPLEAHSRFQPLYFSGPARGTEKEGRSGERRVC